MQAPKDGDAFARAAAEAWTPAAVELKSLQNDRKRLDEPQTTGGTGSSFVTSDCNSPLSEAHRMHNAFTRGFIKGLHPLSHAQVRVDNHAAADYTTYRIGPLAAVKVSGLELVQATDPEHLGVVKGETLRTMVMGAGAPMPEPSCKYTLEPDPVPEGVPVPQVLGWSGGGSPEGSYAVVTLGIEGAAVRYVPERGSVKPGVSDFDHWYASPYARVYERHAAQLHDALVRTDGALSEVLHTLAGEASLCWDPNPAGVFDSSAAIVAVERAIVALRSALRV